MVQASDQDASWPPPFRGFARHVQLGGDPRSDLELAGEITYLLQSGNAAGSPRRSWKVAREATDPAATVTQPQIREGMEGI